MIAYINTLPNAFSLGLIWAIVALGIFISYKVLDIPDLTVDGSLATGGAVCAVIINAGGGFWLGLLAGFIAGVLAGLLTGLLHTFLGIPPILSGILTQLILWSTNYKILGGQFEFIKTATHPVLISLYDPLGALWKMGIVVVLLVVAFYGFFGTQLGASIRATGNNSRMSRAQGINTKFNIVLGLMLSNGIVALGGALYAQYGGRAATDLGVGAIVVGLCSIVIGGAITKRISSNFLIRMSGVVLGALIYQLIFQTILSIEIGSFRFDDDLLKMLAAIVVIIFLGIPYIYKTYLPKRAKQKKKTAED